MSNLKYAVFEEEVAASAVEPSGSTKPYIITKLGQRLENVLTRRVEAALDADFANGSMPA